MYKVRIISSKIKGRHVAVESYYFESSTIAEAFAVRHGLDASLTVDLYKDGIFIRSYTHLKVA